MRVLVIGGGGREHCLVWKIAQSRHVTELWAMPGNPGMEGLARRTDCDISDPEAVAHWAAGAAIDLAVIGPEQPLVAGVADRVRARGILVFGPGAAAARLEGSKAFTRDLARAAGIPAPRYRVFDQAGSALRHLDSISGPVVVKADGLAAGKGVVVAQDTGQARAAVDRMMRKRSLGDAGTRVVIEEYLTGEELSFHVLTDGTNALPMASSQDHKALCDGDRGPNTGGMGAYSPAPVATPELTRAIMNDIIEPAIRELSGAGHRYQGVLYAGLMVTADGPRLLEFNVRLGDPETQVILPRLDGDLVPLLVETARGSLESWPRWRPDAALGVVMAAAGYPGQPRTGDTITGLDEAAGLDGVTVFHAGTARSDRKWVTAGGRVICLTALAPTLARARDRAYEAVGLVRFPGAQFRLDIGHRALA